MCIASVKILDSIQNANHLQFFHVNITLDNRYLLISFYIPICKNDAKDGRPNPARGRARLSPNPFVVLSFKLGVKLGAISIAPLLSICCLPAELRSFASPLTTTVFTVLRNRGSPRELLALALEPHGGAIVARRFELPEPVVEAFTVRAGAQMGDQ